MLAGATKGYCGKKTSGYVDEYRDATFANMIRMVFCILIGFIMIAVYDEIDFMRVDMNVLLTAMLAGVANSAFVVLWLITVKRGAYMMLDVFCTLGVLIPTVGCAIFFEETIRINQIIGFAVLVVAACVMCSYNNGIKSKLTASSFLLLFLCGVSNGLSDFSQKLFVNLTEQMPEAAQTPASVFNFYTYVFSAVILLICFFAFSAGTKEKKPINVKPIFGYILIMSVCLFLNSYFKILAAKYLMAAELYPLSQGGALVLSAAMAAIFFREKLNLKGIIGILMTFAALIIINVL